MIDKDRGSVVRTVRIDRVRLLISVRTTRHLHLVSLSLYEQQQQVEEKKHQSLPPSSHEHNSH